MFLLKVFPCHGIIKEAEGVLDQESLPYARCIELAVQGKLYHSYVQRW